MAYLLCSLGGSVQHMCSQHLCVCVCVCVCVRVCVRVFSVCVCVSALHV